MPFNHYFPYNALTKRPAIPAWQKIDKKISEKDLENTLRKYDTRAALGITLQDDELVIDVDPRNGGDESFKALCAAVGLNLRTCGCAIVRTGGGGVHYYFKHPAKKKIKKKIKNFPGIDFLCGSKYNVIAPGSQINPAHYKYADSTVSGLYEYDDLSPCTIENTIDAPTPLLEVLTSSSAPVAEKSAFADQLTMTLDQIKFALSSLQVVDFREYDQWRDLMFSVKAACGGSEEGKKLFVDWCVQDEKYQDDSDKINLLWEHAEAHRAKGITVKTLYKILIEAGVNLNTLAMLGELSSQQAMQEIKAGTVSPKQWCEWHYIGDWNRFYHVASGTQLAPEGFSALFRRFGKNAAGTFCESPKYAANVVVSSRYEPYRPLTYDQNGQPFLNRWCAPPEIKPTGASIDRWHEHVEYLFSSSPDYIDLFHKYMAALLQKRRRRLNFALVVHSDHEGVGKTTPIQRLCNRAFGRSNVSLLSNEVLNSPFNASLAESEVVFFEDAHATGRFEVIDRLKPWLTDEVVECHPKGKDAYNAKNFASYVIFTNNQDALAISQKSRRFLVLSSDSKPQTSDYYLTLFEWLDKHVDDVVHYYRTMSLDFAHFAQRAPMTEAAERMRKASLPRYAKAFVEVLEEHPVPFVDHFILPGVFYQRFFRRRMSDQASLEPAYGKSLGHLGYLVSESQHRATVYDAQKVATRVRYRLHQSSTELPTQAELQKQFDFLLGIGVDKTEFMV